MGGRGQAVKEPSVPSRSVEPIKSTMNTVCYRLRITCKCDELSQLV